MSKPCTKSEWDSKCREFKIANLLEEDSKEIKEWLYSHYILNTEYIHSGVGGCYIQDPTKIIVLC